MVIQLRGVGAIHPPEFIMGASGMGLNQWPRPRGCLLRDQEVISYIE